MKSDKNMKHNITLQYHTITFTVDDVYCCCHGSRGSTVPTLRPPSPPPGGRAAVVGEGYRSGGVSCLVLILVVSLSHSCFPLIFHSQFYTVSAPPLSPCFPYFGCPHPFKPPPSLHGHLAPCTHVPLVSRGTECFRGVQGVALRTTTLLRLPCAKSGARGHRRHASPAMRATMIAVATSAPPLILSFFLSCMGSLTHHNIRYYLEPWCMRWQADGWV